MTGPPTPRPISTKQARIATLARQMDGTPLRTVAHHMDVEWLREAFRRTRKVGAVGIDGVTAEDYATNLEGNLESLLNRAKSWMYQAPPVRRVHIPKGGRGDKTRPIGIPTLEDKVLQRGMKMLLEPICEQLFYDFSYGFRPRRSAHDALEAIHDGLWKLGGGWVLDADIRGFFDAIDHGHLREMLRHRVVDGVVTRLIGKWLRAGVMEEGVVTHPESGSPQGGVISLLLANLYLHEVLDSWWAETVLPRMRGRAFMVRYADDFVMVFELQADAERVHAVLPQRLERFGLTLHPDKPRLIPFRHPDDRRSPAPGTFDFVGFTLLWRRSRKGTWTLGRKTSSARFSRALRALNEWMSRARHVPLRKQATPLAAKLNGHFNYYGTQRNSKSISRFHYEARRLWRRWLCRRSQRATLNWTRHAKILERYPPPKPHIRARPQQLRLANL
ncbi:MAG: RNA-directed DNA polymerase [Myxococcota bacterium]|jgi:RNA-directed DNA polymerase